ncbi:MAG TPA: response regulator [Actinomycetota bacterium]|jgi:diguanylate cyclase (GGDEF)-like protein|nr:response regulator [Actinomycetota bacterium]
MSDRRDRILVADDDEDIVRFVEVNLRLEGFEVTTVFDGEAALRTAIDLMPDLVLLDVMMPALDGFEVCQRLRSDSRTRHISVIMLTARSLSADKVLGLTAGADDYMIKPFDPIELVARVKSALRRSREMRDVNPLTQLPGNVQVQDEVAKRVGIGVPFALLYVDLDNFKSYNDHYGFLRGDEAIKLLGRCISDAVEKRGDATAFVGHIGGDDFVALVHPDNAEEVAADVIAAWDERAPALYEEPDLARGYVEVADRRGEVRRFPVTTVSIGIASTARRKISSHWEAAEIASEMKQYAKQQPGSSFSLDRRSGDGGGP